MSTATSHIKTEKQFVPVLRFNEFEGKWIANKLGATCKLIMGQSPDSKSYNDEGDGYYLIQGNADIKYRLTSPRQWTNEPTKICEVGDIILTVRAPVGAVARSIHNACIGRGVCVIREVDGFEINFIYCLHLDLFTYISIVYPFKLLS